MYSSLREACCAASMLRLAHGGIELDEGTTTPAMASKRATTTLLPRDCRPKVILSWAAEVGAFSEYLDFHALSRHSPSYQCL
mmetsp:Transcript_11158/g.34427  ORF Transcript_11158/g.34427 Transcript_11158/m.34427 type:complete len:82 (-) Transcript_11158:326-571(-)